MAIHNAIKAVVSPSINIQGCFYHLTQATWQQTQEKDLRRFPEDENIWTWRGSLDGLAFLLLDWGEEGKLHSSGNRLQKYCQVF